MVSDGTKGAPFAQTPSTRDGYFCCVHAARLPPRWDPMSITLDPAMPKECVFWCSMKYRMSSMACDRVRSDSSLLDLCLKESQCGMITDSRPFPTLLLLCRVTLPVEPVLQIENSSSRSLGSVHCQATAHKVGRDLPRTPNNHQQGSTELKVIQVAEEAQSPNGRIQVREVVGELQDPVAVDPPRVFAEGFRGLCDDFLAVSPPLSLRVCASGRGGEDKYQQKATRTSDHLSSTRSEMRLVGQMSGDEHSVHGGWILL